MWEWFPHQAERFFVSFLYLSEDDKKIIIIQIIADAKLNEDTAKNPLLLNAAATANKLTHQLDEMNLLVSKVLTSKTFDLLIMLLILPAELGIFF